MNPEQIKEYLLQVSFEPSKSTSIREMLNARTRVDSDGDRRMEMGVSTVPVNDGRFKAIEEKQEQLLKALGTQAFYIQNLQEAFEKGVSLNADEVQRLHNLEIMIYNVAERQGLQEAQWQTLADDTMKDLTLLRLSLLGVYEDVQRRNQALDNLEDLCVDVEQIKEQVDNHKDLIENLQNLFEECKKKHNGLADVVKENAKTSTNTFEKVAQDLASADNKISDLQSLVKEIAVDQRSLVNRIEALEKKQEADKILIDAAVWAVNDVAREFAEIISKNADHVVHFMAKTEEREQKLIARIEDLEAKIQSMQDDRLLDSLSSALS